MTPDEYAARILAESEEGTQWEWACPMQPPGYRSGWDKLTFGDHVRKLLPSGFEVIQDMGTDTLIVRRVFKTVKPLYLDTPDPPPKRKPKPKTKPAQGELF